ncbi:serine/threonine-protein kinase [Pyxidicoccus fallax]|uniref:serine/threonine-protein kinase n=1 Tax=Pyxidicoccus fallax TaxID=394095 RepID=UPI0031B56787
MGPWRVEGLRGRGTYGAVYRATGVEPHAPGTVALKVALHPRDARFTREAELLSRIRCPGVPRLLEAGEWVAPSGKVHPYLAMEWVEGEPLYAWARRRQPSSRQVLQVLGRLARALESTHAAGGVHRDFKGDNVLARAGDDWPVLIDFGAGHHVGASTLTGPLLPPGTPAYRSPEAWGYALGADPDSAPPYPAGPADDVFALGVTAYRLIAELYPPSTDPREEESHVWSLEGTGVPAVRELNARCCPELSALVSRMLDVRPEARGRARELAEALERAAGNVGPEADVPLYDLDAPRALRVRAVPRRVEPRATGRTWSSWLAAVSLGGALALGVGWMVGMWNTEEPVAVGMETKDGGTVAVGDSALTAPVAPVQAPSAWSTAVMQIPPKPLPGQRRTDANGRCPGKQQVPIHGGCWLKVNIDPKDCAKHDGYVHQGSCYTPSMRSESPPMSSPAEAPARR